MNDGIVIQARSGSTRMPAKILRPFDGERTILDIIIGNICRDNPGKTVVVATTTRDADDAIAAVAVRHGVEVFRGSEDDVLDRFIGAADAFGLDRIVRVCSDNPMLQTGSFAALFAESDRHPEAGYVAFAFPDGRPTIKSHLGLYAELATVEALRHAALLCTGDADEKLYREHVTIYLYTHPQHFRLSFLPLPPVLRHRTDIRLTVDTPSDFSLLHELYSALSSNGDMSPEAMLRLVDANPEYGRIMKQNIAQNEK